MLRRLSTFPQRRGVVIGDGIFRLARLQESSGSGRRSGLHADAVSKRRQCAGTRHYQVRQPACALDDHGVGLEWAALSAGQCLALLVSAALRRRWQALATDWDCGRGPQVTHCALAFPRDPGLTRGGGALRGGNSLAIPRHASAWVLVNANSAN